MRKNILILICIFVLATAFILIGCTKNMVVRNHPDDLRYCEQDSDCTIVEGKSCCACHGAINKKYLDYWNSLEYQECTDPSILCTDCLHPDLMKVICNNNYCKAVAK